MSERSNDDGAFPGNILRLVQQFLERRYLGNLSDDKREQFRENFEAVRRTLLDRRPPRIAVAGAADTDLEELLTAIAGDAVPTDLEVKEYLGRGRWYDYEVRGVHIELLDLRRQNGEAPEMGALDRQSPDVVLFDWRWPDEMTADEAARGDDETVRDLERLVERARNSEGATPHVVGLVDETTLPEEVTANRAERVLRDLLRGGGVWGPRVRVLRRGDIRTLDSELVEMAPLEARLGLARAVQTSASKQRLARAIIRSSAGITAAVATIPLPFADIIPITGVQMAMIATIGHVSGRQFSVRTVGEFAAAIGLNVGAGFALREVARALVQFVPFAGSVISSGIAAGATYALGNAATRYFIDQGADEFDAAPRRVQTARE